MKIVREHINEKFSDASDPVKDIGVGIDSLLKPHKWMILSNYLNGMTIKDRAIVRKGMKIKNDHTMYLGEKNTNENIKPFVKNYLANIKKILEKSPVVFAETYTEYVEDNHSDITTTLTVYDTPIGRIGEFKYEDKFPGLIQYFGDPQAFLELKPYDILRGNV